MFITIASYKGGVAKTTTALHIAGFFQQKFGSTILVDGDANRSALHWSKRGQLPFEVVDERQGLKSVRNFEHVIVDTKARPEKEDLEAIAASCDLLIVPTPPHAMEVDALLQIIPVLSELKSNYSILLTMVPPPNQGEGDLAREALHDEPLFASSIKNYKAYKKAALQGCLVNEVRDPNTRRIDRYSRTAWKDYVRLGEEIINEWS